MRLVRQVEVYLCVLGKGQVPNLPVGEGILPRGHARPTDPVFDFPKRKPFGIILNAI
jgi:hypothetical protein